MANFESNTSFREIEIWKKKLLDLGKRNNLVNFHDTKSSTLEVLYPDFSVAFNKIVAPSAVQVFDDKSEDYDFDDYDEEEPKRLNKQQYLLKYSRRVPQSQILLFNAYKPAKKILRTLMKKASDSINERGVNILYAAFGFLEWFDSDNTQFKYRAPILMVPLMIKNESISGPIYINQFDDDIAVNPTLKYLLENKYGISLPEFDEQDVDSYLNEVKSLVYKQRWTVHREAKIATFTFNKLNMYLDLEYNASKIALNPNVKLLTDAEASESDLVLNEEEFDEISNSRDLFIKQHNVVDADFSQTEAIEYALMGKSFVLQGPPGTGKSQTITNMIAELIYAGKKVLFVSEKMAALEVVYNNMKKAKLSDYCLQLHSYKANKRDFLDDLYYTILKSKTVVDNHASDNATTLSYAKDRLNKYDTKLYEIHQPINMSLHQLIGLANHLSNIEPIPYVVKDIYKLDSETISNNVLLLKRYESYSKSLGYDYRNFALNGLIINDFSFAFKLQIKELLDKHYNSISNLLSLIHEANESYKVSIDRNNIEAFADFVEFALENSFIDYHLFDFDLLSTLIIETKKLKTLSTSIKQKTEALDTKYKKIFFKEDPAKLSSAISEQGSSLFKRLFNKNYKELMRKLSSYRKDSKKCTRDGLLRDLKTLAELNNAKKEFDSFSTLKNCGLPQYNGYDTDWDSLLNTIKKLVEQLKEHREFKTALLNVKGAKSFKSKVSNAIKEHQEATKAIMPYIDARVFDASILSLDVLAKINRYINNIDKIDMWADMLALLSELEKADLIRYVNMFTTNNRPIDQLEDTYRLVCYKQLIDYILQYEPELNSYNRFMHEHDVSLFSEKDKIQLDISKALINEKLSKLRPDPMLSMSGTPIGIIKREHEKKRKLKPIRLLMKEIPEFIQTIKPCFLMSPLSVSTFLSDNVKFDVTIFDEASQVFPEDAIVAVYRSKQLIVVGDSKQMPPSKFFMSSDLDDDEYEEEESDIDSYESILDLCSTTFPTKSLLCHYRSRDESLIAFSNKNFYRFNLLTYPSVHEKEDDLGVDFIHVKNGVMDSRSKINIAEAERVVDLVYDHFKKHPGRSLGVVAFNIRQQDAILKLLDKRRTDDPSLEEFFKTDKEEPFFVKNLETVQGDERDTIIFSVTYAPNDKGQFALRFGPLNLVGGERRLNVAITRAKLNVKVVSSIRAIDIDVSRVSNEGPRLLHDYLDYAEHGVHALESAISVDEKAEFESPFEQDVYEFLRDQGFEVSTQVGCSRYRIDLAIKRPGTSDYVLAIECDGAAYHSSRSARDRDRLRQAILERMNWKFYRIWSTDWYKNNFNEKKALAEACKKALEETKDNFSETNKKEEKADITDLVQKIPAAGSVKLYADYRIVHPNYNQATGLTGYVNEILRIEAPASVEYILKRTCHLWGNEKVTSVIRRSFRYHFNSSICWEENGFYYTRSSKELEMRSKIGIKLGDVNYISLYELRNGMYQAVEYFKQCGKEELFAFIRTQIGFDRAGDKITKRLEEAFELLKPYIKITSDGSIALNDRNILKIIKRP